VLAVLMLVVALLLVFRNSSPAASARAPRAAARARDERDRGRRFVAQWGPKSPPLNSAAPAPRRGRS
jgi:hypothetical protein